MNARLLGTAIIGLGLASSALFPMAAAAACAGHFVDIRDWS